MRRKHEFATDPIPCQSAEPDARDRCIFDYPRDLQAKDGSVAHLFGGDLGH